MELLKADLVAVIFQFIVKWPFTSFGDSSNKVRMYLVVLHKLVLKTLYAVEGVFYSCNVHGVVGLASYA